MYSIVRQPIPKNVYEFPSNVACEQWFSMANLDLLTEIEKLAHVLKVPTERLHFLRSLSMEDFQVLNQTISDRLLTDSSNVWSKLAGVAKFMPNFINAQVAKSILGPNITANLTYHIDTKHAVSIAKSLNIDFLAEVAENLVPARAKHLIEAFPMEVLVNLTRVLTREKKYFTMGAFVDYMDVEKIHALSKEIPDTESLLRVGLYTQNKEHVAKLLDGFADEKIIELVETAQRKDLWPAVIGLLAHFSDAQHQRLASLVGRVSVDALLGMVPFALEHGALVYIFAFLKHLNADMYAHMATICAKLDSEALAGLIEAADESNELKTALKIADHLAERDVERLSAMSHRFEDALLKKVILTAHAEGLIPFGLRLLALLPETEIPRAERIAQTIDRKIIKDAQAQIDQALLKDRLGWLRKI
ncbi:MAG: hypothetical protein LDLANPLL_00605 [Turneriella sp.]|nr:hypothetical protein [Turneriella sp.]